MSAAVLTKRGMEEFENLRKKYLSLNNEFFDSFWKSYGSAIFDRISLNSTRSSIDINNLIEKAKETIEKLIRKQQRLCDEIFAKRNEYANLINERNDCKKNFKENKMNVLKVYEKIWYTETFIFYALVELEDLIECVDELQKGAQNIFEFSSEVSELAAEVDRSFPEKIKTLKEIAERASVLPTLSREVLKTIEPKLFKTH